MSNIEKFLGANTQFRLSDCTPQELSTQAKLYSTKENRDTFKTKDDVKAYDCMIEKACEGMDTKFSLLEPISKSAEIIYCDD